LTDERIAMQQYLAQAYDKLHRARRKLATAGVGVFAVLLGSHLLFGVNGWMAYSKKKETHQQIQQEIHSLQQENERLQQQIKALKTDPKAIEKEAREQLKYTRPGEVVYTMPAPPPAKPAQSSTARTKLT